MRQEKEGLCAGHGLQGPRGCSWAAPSSPRSQPRCRGGCWGVGCGSCKKQTNKERQERGAALSSQLLLPPGQCLYVSLPALLECNPFPNPSEGREGWRASPPLPEELRRVVLTYQEVLDLLRQYEVHPEITSQMFAYLFFFSNTLLFNQLLDKGQSSSSSSSQSSPQSVPVPPAGGPGERWAASSVVMGTPSTNPAPIFASSGFPSSASLLGHSSHGFGFCGAHPLPGSR